MSLSLEEVRKAAKLTRIRVEPAEEVRYAQELSAILQYVDRLQAVDTTEVHDQAVFSDQLPPDRDLPRLDEQIHEAIIQNFPDRLSDLLRVPGVFPKRSLPS
ncbi:Asp-tRNA(Asn)/Glu-tRNA(Gln) amidotransferase subunit GatC [Patescibacteria group bacterium]|nr:Asp-tRNA(Asn)/Glu-tRNA(Gln) amidotransferase subunit GatC [Patescibacteria group bacterium]